MTGATNTDETEQTLKAAPDFSAVAEEFGPAIEADLERMWSTIYRGWCSSTFDLSAEEAIVGHEIYICPDECLSSDEIEDLELFTAELGKCRSPDRAFDNLTAVEYSILKILRGAARRRLADEGGDQ